MDICLGQHTFFLDFIQSISSIFSGKWRAKVMENKDWLMEQARWGSIRYYPSSSDPWYPWATIFDPPTIDNSWCPPRPGTKPTSLYDLASHAPTLTSLGSRAASEGWMVGFNQQTKTYFAGWTLTKCMLGVWMQFFKKTKCSLIINSSKLIEKL